MTSNSNTLVGYAVLRANFNANASSYIDNFQAFALDVLSTKHPEFTSSHDVAKGIQDRFGLFIPDLVVGKILRRARISKFVEGDPQVGFTLTKQGLLEIPQVGRLADDYGRKQAELVAKFRTYVEEKHETHTALLEADLTEKLSGYFEAHAVPLLAQSLRGRKLPARQIEPGYDYLISSFVAHCAQEDSAGFGYIEDAVKGAILAAVVLLDTSSLQSSLDGVALYLDTPVLIDVLGYHGDAAQGAAEQMLSLAEKLGARIAAFEHSVRELEGVLSNAQFSLRPGAGRRESTGRMLAQFIAERATPADVAIHKEQVHDDLSAARIEIKPRPADYGSYGLDEARLEDELNNLIRYRFAGARRHDVDSLSAVHRLRKGENSSKLERTRAMLITTNSGLARASQHLAGEDHVWPLAMTASAIASLLWVRSPTVSEELPRKQLLASAYAGMQPDSYLWGKYLDEVALLETRGELLPEDALLLRVGMEPRLALMEATLGASDEISPETLVDVLDRLKHDAIAPVAEQLSDAQEREVRATRAADEASASWLVQQNVNEQLRKQMEDAEATSAAAHRKLEEFDKRESLRIEKIRARSIRSAKKTVLVVTLAIGTPIVLLAISAFLIPSATSTLPAGIKVAALIAGATLVALAAIRAFVPGTVGDWLKKLEQPLARRYENRVLRRAGVEG